MIISRGNTSNSPAEIKDKIWNSQLTVHQDSKLPRSMAFVTLYCDCVLACSSPWLKFLK